MTRYPFAMKHTPKSGVRCIHAAAASEVIVF